MGKLVPTVRTVVSIREYTRAVLRAWHVVGEGTPRRESVAVLYAQYIVETGGKACWNWNVGNRKKANGDGHDYQMLHGVWEGVTPAEAERLIASGEAVLDPNPAHARQVGPNRVAVVYQPPHRATWFVAYPSLAVAMEEHLQFLRKRFGEAWSSVLAGDADGFAYQLKERRYFTASAKAYAADMRPAFKAFVVSPVYGEVLAELASGASEAAPTTPDDIPTVRELPVLEDDGGASRWAATLDAVPRPRSTD